ncbi:DEKNAAC103621 [Brettanomyces naardenensis]|uniref:DEKNAAC103621 n=1 Tax=Brettanomyces naardenensis TaxID=13370 RepID=A0A448YP28_BRENA|nr:DEKNAAC103621 [Brettanomyces naardenensis]
MSLMRRLSKVPGMLPYISLAYSRAEENAEKQAIALSTAASNSASSGSSVRSSSNRSSNVNHSYTGSNDRKSKLSVSPRGSVSSQSSDALLGHWSSTLFTFAAGILPAQIAYDPVTPIWNLFQQGAPLCLIFNAISPENAIDVVSSDDLKVCKMSVYQFLSACKLHLNIRDDELFPITSVFSDDIRNLLEVIHSVDFVLDLDQRFDVSPVEDQLTITDSRSKVVKELIESERKFVYDLETLARYKDDLTRMELISSENINMLFPNLNEIVDFQRRLLVGLECNAVAPGKYQRIGSVFVHAGVQGFQVYEAWSLFQNSAIEFINKEAATLKRSSDLIANPYELQSFLIKPIQRLCKYPLLLRELLKLTDPSWPNYSELQAAYSITREVAAGINEAQRKSENLKLMNELQEQVVDWKGYTLAGVGDLLFSNVVTVRDLLNEGHAGEKEVHCYLFERVIYFFKEHKEKNKLLSGRKKSSASSLSTAAVSSSHMPQLSLNGIVYISKIYKVATSDTSPYFASTQGHFLTLRWRGSRDTGGCVVRFRSEEHMNQWDSTIRQLSGSEDEDEFVAPPISMGHRSTSSVSQRFRSSSSVSDGSSSFFFSKPRATSTSTSSFGVLVSDKKLRSVSSPAAASIYGQRSLTDLPPVPNFDELQSNFSGMTLSQKQFTQQAQYENRTRIKLIFGPNSENVHLSVSPDIDFSELVEVLVNKANYVMGANGGGEMYNVDTVKLKFKDEDGDLIRFQSNDDWEIAKEMLDEIGDEEERILTVKVR